ncbi:hypothetical protein SynBMKMC1_01986 [Synechococcus sp. BMK-MC-1]|nr:hypothetical protein SynBMKMC1_01986 [Synechococcus sp. BMK-MC-1]
MHEFIRLSISQGSTGFLSFAHDNGSGFGNRSGCEQIQALYSG